MFLSKNYVLGSELVEKMGIHIANISIARKKLETQGNVTDIIKMGNCTFLNKDSIMLPNNLKVGLNTYQFTDISNMLPSSYIIKEFKLNKKILNNLIENHDSFIKEISISKKQLTVFTPEFIKNLENTIPYMLNEAETMECYNTGSIDDYIKLDNNKYLTWYDIGD